VRLRRGPLDTPYPQVRPYASPPSGRRSIPIPDTIGRIFLPLSVLQATDGVMRRCGRERRECYVWWGGYFLPNGSAQIVTALWPDVPTKYGHIHLSHEHLVVLHERLRELDLVLVAELHTHPPGAGGQNDVDAANAVASYRGFISIVVPDFAHPHFHDLRRSYVYEYAGQSQWKQLSETEIEQKFIVEETINETRHSL